MDGQEIMWRAVKVDFAKENPERLAEREAARLAAETNPTEEIRED